MRLSTGHGGQIVASSKLGSEQRVREPLSGSGVGAEGRGSSILWGVGKLAAQERRVFVLGAGFTKAFFPAAPLVTDDYNGVEV